MYVVSNDGKYWFAGFRTVLWILGNVCERSPSNDADPSCQELLHQARLAGVNLFDNAEVYGNPGGEPNESGEAMAN